MEPRLPRLLAIRGILIALPFVVWFAWAWVARRTGRPMGTTPWSWLVAAGLALFCLSLLASVVFHPDNRRERYVPGEATASGAVTAGHFEKPKP
jgi:hypothetical protein